jgi:hypothetical protein
MYFWCTSGEDGTRIEALTDAQVKDRLREIERGQDSATFLSSLPSSDKGYWITGIDDAVVLLRGSVVVPKAVQRVTEYSLEEE